MVAILGWAYGLSGNKREAQKVLYELESQSKRRYVSPFDTAIVYLGLRDKDEAFAWLGKAYEERSAALVYLKVAAYFDPLRDDPRFHDQLLRMNLAP